MLCCFRWSIGKRPWWSLTTPTCVNLHQIWLFPFAVVPTTDWVETELRKSRSIRSSPSWASMVSGSPRLLTNPKLVMQRTHRTLTNTMQRAGVIRTMKLKSPITQWTENILSMRSLNSHSEGFSMMEGTPTHPWRMKQKKRTVLPLRNPLHQFLCDEK